MRLIILLGISLSIAACDLPSERPSTPQTFAPNTATVFSADSPDERFLVCRADRRYEGRWTPTQQEIDALEPVLIELLEYKLAEDQLAFSDPFEFAPVQYHRHYFGVIREGRRYILICGRHGREPIYEFDGGASRFASFYDAQYRTFTWFEFGDRA